MYSLGDSAITIQLGAGMAPDVHERVMAFAERLRQNMRPEWEELVFAYNSVTLFYNVRKVRAVYPERTAFDAVKRQVEALLDGLDAFTPPEPNLIRLPVLYDGPDLEALSTAKGIGPEDLIALHANRPYRVYFLGFLPGFAYMGEVDEQIFAPRKKTPVPTRAGSVGIAGRQTGIYPWDSPGGWQIVGRTPVALYDERRTPLPTLLRAGDRVVFYPCTQDEFERYQSGAV